MRIALFGDSITEGLGVRNSRYGQRVADALGAELIDYSTSGWTIAQSLEEFRVRPADVDWAVIAHGFTEPIIRPRLDGVPVPQRWRQLGWMDPRPYYSSRLRRRILERIESAVRWRVKNFLIRTRGSYQFMSPEEYERSLIEFLAVLRARGAQVIVLGPTPIDDRYFPNATSEMQKYAEIDRLAAGDSFLSVADSLQVWRDFFADHYHPNHSGHAKIAWQILERIRSTTRDATTAAPSVG